MFQARIDAVLEKCFPLATNKDTRISDEALKSCKK